MAKTVETIFKMDNMLGYRWGWLLWLAFVMPSVGVMLAEPEGVGAPRDFLLQANLFSCLSVVYFSFFFWQGIPASTPSVHALMAETCARLLLVSYYGLDQVTGDSNAIGYWNWIQVITGFVFGIGKLSQNAWILWNRREYMAYENELKETFH